ncbi:hypothetical protein TNCV_4788331 [Trichonephila clavipes]|nr:hypothetical protein TNCV_4788331 [Trichonephila clavipes]
MPTARGIRRWKGLDFKSVVKRLVGDSTLWFRFTPILREHRWSGVPSRFPLLENASLPPRHFTFTNNQAFSGIRTQTPWYSSQVVL